MAETDGTTDRTFREVAGGSGQALGTPDRHIDELNGSGSSGVASFVGRVGAVVPVQADYDGFFLTPVEGDAAYVAKVALLLPHVHTWAVAGEIKVPATDVDFIVPMFMFVPTGWTAVVSRCRYVINAGTSVTAKLQKNGVDLTGFTAISVTTTAATTDPADQAIADTNKLALVVTAVAGTPLNMSFSVELRLAFAG